MPFRRRRRNMRMTPIHSVKNQMAQKQSITANALVLHFIQTSVEVGQPTKITGVEVPVGAKVHSVDVSVNFISGTASSTGNFDWCLMKIREGQDVAGLITNPDWTNIGLANGRNQVIKSYMGIFATEDAGAMRYNVHIKIPRIMQRVRAGDQLVIAVIATSAGDLSTGARYKYYT